MDHAVRSQGDIVRTLSAVMEDLAVELLAHFSEEELPHLGKTLDNLQNGWEICHENGIEPLYP